MNNNQTSMNNLDEVDLAIIRELQKDARLSVRELSSRVHRSSTAVFERLKRLETEGAITGYSVLLNREKIGRGFTVFCNVKLRRVNAAIHADFAQAVEAMPEVAGCYNVSGGFDYLLKVEVPDMPSYRKFVTERLGTLDILDAVQSVFVMEEVFNRPPAL